MAIIWGEKRVEDTLGYVAEFCPICREIRTFLVSRMGVVSHIYYLPIGQPKSAIHLAECQSCRTKILVNPDTYMHMAKVALKDLENLIEVTYPNLRANYAARLELEDRIRTHQGLTSSERHTMLIEPWRYLSMRVEERYANNAKFDNESRWGCFGTIILTTLFGCGAITMSQSGLIQEILLISAGLIACVGLVYTVIQLLLAPGRFVQRDVMPQLACTLAPLNPTQAEISNCLDQMKDSRIGKKISAVKLWNALQQLRSVS